jgi:hypothetical protein
VSDSAAERSAPPWTLLRSVFATVRLCVVFEVVAHASSPSGGLASVRIVVWAGSSVLYSTSMLRKRTCTRFGARSSGVGGPGFELLAGASLGSSLLLALSAAPESTAGSFGAGTGVVGSCIAC